ncbi:hypothetical protein GCM10011375_32790 [Hymenobacter qilianensis]|uniref:L,D-transpeptidase family protein n=2 Tax=Hymenobacter qilianensis TaxID=1385715 RepID=A0A7H0GT23_9BACT|nr:L,D-transpeptidase family protein [Hymenobacter qilianensis]QNP51439.1 L,D-transpeptidase family protein [Hymenobacter qilianensis]GGF75128.1 hypothetical protein GCM10011375_32790 [Hymenobacter qilianensis]
MHIYRRWFLALLLTMPPSLRAAPAPNAYTGGNNTSAEVSQTAPKALAARIQGLLRPKAAWAQHQQPAIDPKEARSFYTKRRFVPAWSTSQQPNATGRAALAFLAGAEDYGLQPSAYHAPALVALTDSLTWPTSVVRKQAQQARFEVLLTDGLVQFAKHLRRGRLHAFVPSPLEKVEGPFDPVAWVSRALEAPDFAAALLSCQPRHREYQQLQQALVRWRQHPKGPDSIARQRRAEQIALTLERWRWDAIPDSTYVLINLAAYAMEVVDNGRVRQTHRLVVGRSESPTPTLSSRLTSFTVAPEWHVPHSIATTEILPYLQENAKYPSEHDFLAENNYSLYDAKGRRVDPATVKWQHVTAKNFPYSIRQNPGCGNTLGNIIFRFANPYSVYLHATSETSDFELANRALGHGCLRTERPMQLAAYLLGPDSSSVALPSEAECEAAPKPRTITLRRPMPFYVRYATCAVVAGELKFYPDIYSRDEALRRQLFAPQRSPRLPTAPIE